MKDSTAMIQVMEETIRTQDALIISQEKTIDRKEKAINRILLEKAALQHDLAQWRLTAQGWELVQTDEGYQATRDNQTFVTTESWWHLEKRITTFLHRTEEEAEIKLNGELK